MTGRDVLVQEMYEEKVLWLNGIYLLMLPEFGSASISIQQGAPKYSILIQFWALFMLALSNLLQILLQM
jgi:hypothetical protein